MMDHDENLEKIRGFLRERLEEAGAEEYVLGLSGGMDSAIAAQTVIEALEPGKLTCWVMPGEPSSKENMRDARQLAEDLSVELHEVPITRVVEGFEDETPFELDRKTLGNVRARARMVFCYIDANQNDKLVLGADNRSEIELGYFTKYGDGAVDVMPFADLYKTELRDFGRNLGVPEKFIEKTPTAGLWKGQTDQDELGETYEVIDSILRCLEVHEMDVVETAEETGEPLEKVRRFRRMVKNSEHKRSRPPYPELR